MHIKKPVFNLTALLFGIFLLDFISAHVCGDVLPGGAQYNPGCDPFILTVPGGASQNGNQVTLTINVENRQTPFAPASSCGNPWSGTLSNVRISAVNPGPLCAGCFSMNNPGTNSISINTNRDYNTVVTINSGATPGTYSLNFTVSSSGVSDRYVSVSGIEVTSSGCTSDANCSGSTPYCYTSNGSCVVCLNDGNCNDNNECTSDSCSSYSCVHSNVANGNTCNSTGHCCSGTCALSIGNSGFSGDCRSGPSCVGSSWEYSLANNGVLCGSFSCRQCSNGYCNYDNNSRCTGAQICSGGSCTNTLNCTNDANCSQSIPYCNTTLNQCVGCLNNGHCDDNNECTSDSCSGGSCSHNNVADGTSCSVGSCSSGSCRSGDGNNGNGGNGGNAGNIPSTSTYVLNENQLQQGNSKELKGGDKIKFQISGQDHYVAVDSVSSSSVKINVTSSLQQSVLLVGETKKFEVSDDGWYDVSVKLENISNGKANLTIKGIHEVVSTTETQQAQSNQKIVNNSLDQNQTAQDNSSIEKSKKNYTFILIVVGIIVLIIIVVIILFFIGKKSKSEVSSDNDSSNIPNS